MCWSPIIVLNFPPSFAYIFLNHCNIMSKNISALREFVEYMFQYIWNCIEIDTPLVINVVHIKRGDTIFKSGPFALFGSVIWEFFLKLLIKIIFVGIMGLYYDSYNIYSIFILHKSHQNGRGFQDLLYQCNKIIW